MEVSVTKGLIPEVGKSYLVTQGDGTVYKVTVDKKRIKNYKDLPCGFYCTAIVIRPGLITLVKGKKKQWVMGLGSRFEYE